MAVAFEIAIIVLLLLVNGFFAMSEMAIVSARRPRLQAWAEDGRRGAATALRLAENPSRFLSSVQIGITLVGILAGAFGGATLAEVLAVELSSIALLAPIAEGLSIAVVVGLITYGSLIIGELVPKQIALSNPEAVAAAVAGPMAVLAKAAAPVVWLLETSSRLAMVLLRIRPVSDQTMTAEEVKAVIAEGTESGVIEQGESEMIAGVLRLGDRRIKAIMTPRHEVVWIDLAWDSDRIAHTLRTTRHSRFPVCQGDINDVVGIVQAKDLLERLLAGQPLDLQATLRAVQVVHDNSPALHAVQVLKASQIHMVVVVDEYGSVEGIMTAADILSAIVGSLAENGSDDTPTAVQRADGSWLMDGNLPVDIAAERLGLRRLAEDDQDFSTLAGFALTHFRVIPTAGDGFEWQGWRFEVMDMDGRRIDKVLATRIG